MTRQLNRKRAEARRIEKKLYYLEIKNYTQEILQYAKEDNMPYHAMASDGSFCEFYPDGSIKVIFNKFEVWAMDHGHYASQREEKV